MRIPFQRTLRVIWTTFVVVLTLAIVGFVVWLSMDDDPSRLWHDSTPSIQTGP